MDQLILEGDWACTSGDSSALIRVCDRVAEEQADFAGCAEKVSRWAPVDMVAASMYWADLVTQLRHRRPEKPAPRGTSLPATM